MKNVLRLSEAASTETARRLFSADMARSVDACISGLTGLKGLFIRNSYKLVKNMRPGYIEHILFVMNVRNIRKGILALVATVKNILNFLNIYYINQKNTSFAR